MIVNLNTVSNKGGIVLTNFGALAGEVGIIAVRALNGFKIANSKKLKRWNNKIL